MSTLHSNQFGTQVPGFDVNIGLVMSCPNPITNKLIQEK